MRRPDPFTTGLILLVAALFVYVLILLGRSPAAFFLPSAQAGESELTWTAPTKNCNGSDLTDLAGYSLIYSQTQQDLPKVLTHRVTGLKPGVWWFSLAAVNAAGERSEFVTVSDTILPEEFVTTSTTAYTVIKRRDSLLMLPVGTVPLGTQCLAGQTVNGYYVVPRASVTFTGGARPEVVFASCG